jgi:hypothetical protein
MSLIQRQFGASAWISNEKLRCVQERLVVPMLGVSRGWDRALSNPGGEAVGQINRWGCCLGVVVGKPCISEIYHATLFSL